MDYIQNNKAAWEEAFEHRKPGWGENNHERLLGEHLPFFCADVARELEAVDWSSRAVAQFCCNNGRELLLPPAPRRGERDRLRHRGKHPRAGGRNREKGGRRQLPVRRLQHPRHPGDLPQ